MTPFNAAPLAARLRALAEWPAGDDFVTAVVEQTGQPR